MLAGSAPDVEERQDHSHLRYLWQAAAEVAAAAGAAFIDINESIARRYDQMGPDAIKPMFPSDHTHTNRAGAEINAECVIAGLKGLKEDPLRDYYAAGGAGH